MKTKKKKAESNEGIREQLFNEGECGVVTEVSTPVDLITSLRGVLLDIDLKLFKPSGLIPDPDISPAQFYERHVSKWLSRHPVLDKAEVRCSGSGLHVLLLLDEPVQLRDELDRQRWAARVQVIQAILPSDPHQPGIQAMTRKVGSINEKNKQEVTVIKEGRVITEKELLDLVNQILSSPFKTISQALWGKEQISPCPACNKQESRLGAGDHAGKCYGCGTVHVDGLIRAAFGGAAVGKKEVAHARK